MDDLFFYYELFTFFDKNKKSYKSPMTNVMIPTKVILRRVLSRYYIKRYSLLWEKMKG